MESTTLEGVLDFHSETGTEGGYWAFMDKNFITQNTTRFSCATCYRYWDKADNPEGPPLLGRIDSRKHCEPDEHDFRLVSDENWSYEGLHILKDGDYLIIYDKEDSSKVVWEGEIKLIHHASFTEHVFGFWIHDDQEGFDQEMSREFWATWFFKNHPARLVKSKPS